ncbi:predicted protein [Arabidopsis lyrata subsp. lyrata]|uniref:Predicted protein n=1 Tax=Arabidopsis lyrata subsp. lyrata TaxID=81972 RepID=D7M9E1_ARALL|nr:predicted protein [Arabidopsis lyrata subsp. lyrata]
MDPLGQWLDDQDIERWSPPSSRTASLDDTPPCSPRSSSGGSYASSDDYVPSSGPDTPPSSLAKGSTDTSCSEKSGSSKEGTSKEGSSQEGSSQSSPPPSSEQEMSPPAVAYADEAESSRRVRRRIGEPRPLSSPGHLGPQSLTMDTLSIQDTVKKIEPGGRDFIPGRICYPQDFLTNSDCYVRAKTQDWLAKVSIMFKVVNFLGFEN